MGYRSTYEAEVAMVLEGLGFEYEPWSVEYPQYRTYTPDFYADGVLVECKGYFRPGDQAKYKAIRDQVLSMGEELVFLFMSPNKPVRKGSKMTMGRWADKEGIRWFDEPKELVKYVDNR